MAQCQTPQVTDFRWNELPSIPTPRAYCAATYKNKCLYVVGGCDPLGKAIDVAEAYNFTKRTWELLPPAPNKRAGCIDVVTFGEKLLFVGGTNEKQEPLAAIDVLNTDTKTWESFPPLPSGRIKPVVQLVESKLFVIGGAGMDRVGEADAHYLDLDKLEWMNLPSMANKRYTAGSVVYKNKIYVVGGRVKMKSEESCEILNLATLDWEPMPPLPGSSVFYSVISHEGDIFVMGGMIPPSQFSKKVWRFRMADQCWESARDMLCTRTDFAAGFIASRIIVTGGVGLGPTKDPMGRSETEAMTANKRKWEKLPNMIKPRLSMTVACWENNMAVIGGLGKGGPTNVVEVLTIEEGDN